MMKNIVLLAIIVSFVSAQQNLCGPRVRNPQWVQDWSACRSYLFCNYNAENTLQSVHQLMCPENHSFNAALQACDGTGGTVCDNTESQCPPSGTIMIADRHDPACGRFHLCSNGQLIRNAGQCFAPSVFNRNFGTCTPASLAPCMGIVDGYCVPGQTNFFPVWGSCTRHVFCRNGVIEGEFECPPGTHFNTMSRGCDNPATMFPPCPFA